MTFKVLVIDDEQRPQTECCVEVHLPVSFPLSSDSGEIVEYTDADGRATFEKGDAAFGEVSVLVNGANKGRFDLDEGAEITVII